MTAMKSLLQYVISRICVWLILPLTGLGQDIHFDLVQRPQDQLGAAVIALAQDQRGLLWIGTTNGLFKFDGSQYTAYHNQPSNHNSISDDVIECIAADQQGYIWIGCLQNASGLDRLDPSTGIFSHFHHHENDAYSVSSDTVYAILQDHEGTIWVGTENGLDRFDSKTNRFYHYQYKENDPASLSFNQVRAIYEDKEGVLWVGTGSPWPAENIRKEGGLNRLDKKTGKFTRWLHNDKDPNSLTDNRIRAIFEDSHGNFWVGSAGDGLHKMDRKTGRFERLLYNPSHPDGLSRPPVKGDYSGGEDHITFITEDVKGRLWIGTHNGGINVYDPVTKKSSWYGLGKNSREKLQENNFWAACRTSDGLLWISTFNLNFYKINPYRLVIPHTYTGFITKAFAEDEEQTLWFATNKGLVHQDNKGIIHKLSIDKDSSWNTNKIFFIQKDNNNRLWFASLHGLFYMDSGTNKIVGYHSEVGYTSSVHPDTIFMINKVKDNNLCLATSRGLKILDVKTGVFTTYLHDPEDTNSLYQNYIYSLATSKNEDIWVGTMSGISRLNRLTGKFKRYPGQFQVFCLLEDSEENFWAGTGNGLFRYDRKADIFLPFTDQAGIINKTESIFGLAEDSHQNLWLNTSGGILRMNKERNETMMFGKNYGIEPASLTRHGFTRKNGEVLFGDSTGYYTFNGSLSNQDTSRPLVNISRFLLNDIAVEPSPHGILSVPLEQTEEIRLKYNQNTFSIGFSTIDFVSDPQYSRLIYMLQNYDNNWRQSNESREAFYFNLPPGKYLFKVKAYGANGRSAEKQIGVIIAPPWWTSWWAYTFYGLCLVIGIFFADRIQRKVVIEKERQRTRERELAQAKEIEKAYKQLETAHENLKATQGQLVQAEKMASLGELTAGIAHEIQNPLNFMNNFSEVNTELIDEMKEELKAGNNKEAFTIADNIAENERKINYHGRRADAIVKSMLQHSRISSGKKEPADINALADEYLRLSYHGLRARDNLFNVTMKTDFDQTIHHLNVISQDIGRVLLNLYNNAFYAVNEKRKTAGADYEPTLWVSTKKINNRVEMMVKDNGGGITQKVKDKIFQPFFTTKPTGQGTGLGLSLSYDIIKAHGGEIRVETKEGEFTEFVVQIPEV
jgi:ligand-binding sensor domain-containing protein/signal transduction histidine kinase